MSDLVNQLLALADCDARAGEPLGKCMREAAARIAELEAEVARLRAYGDPAFYVCAAAQWEKATARAKREAEDWKRAAQTANKRAISDDATIRGLRKKLDAAPGITSA